MLEWTRKGRDKLGQAAWDPHWEALCTPWEKRTELCVRVHTVRAGRRGQQAQSCSTAGFQATATVPDAGAHERWAVPLFQMQLTSSLSVWGPAVRVVEGQQGAVSSTAVNGSCWVPSWSEAGVCSGTQGQMGLELPAHIGTGPDWGFTETPGALNCFPQWEPQATWAIQNPSPPTASYAHEVMREG